MTAPVSGRSLELYFIDGRPDGMLTAEVFNWTGHLLMTPRTQLAKALKRDEARRTGVYLLIGEQEGEPTAYVGEAEELGKRLRNHTEKDWWTSAVLISTAGDGLHKAHVKYLEARLIEIAHEVGRVSLSNGNVPARPSLSEAHVANMEVFLDTLLMVLPALRVDVFLNKRRVSRETEAPSPEASQPIFELQNNKHGLKATAILDNGEFIVKSGSTARLTWEGSTEAKTSYFRLHQDLIDTGVLVEIGGKRQFTSDYAFSSTSAAGAVVNGRSTRGPTAWKVLGTGKSYADWEAEQLAAKEVAA